MMTADMIGRYSKTAIDTLYRFLSRFDEDRFVSLITALLNSCCVRRKRRGRSTILVDGTAITLDLNGFRKIYTKDQLESQEFRGGYSPSQGHYIGYKLTLAIEYPVLHPVCILLHPGSPHDAPLFEESLTELKRRRAIRIRDMVVCGKGYCS